MVKAMRDAFAERADRFRLLDEGVKRIRWKQDIRLLEIGCATGEAAAHMAHAHHAVVTGVDVDAAAIHAATERYGSGRCSFVCADAGELPFDAASFDGMYCEASFAPLDGKERAAAEYARVLKPGARLLMNDFAIRFETPEMERTGVDGIPCFKGVQTMAAYQSLFRDYGFELLHQQEDHPELLRIALRMSQIYGVKAAELGAYLVRQFAPGGESGQGDAFFSKARMTYCQMIFKRNG